MNLAKKIDNYFYRLKKSEQIIISLTIAFAIIVLTFEYLQPVSEAFMKRMRAAKSALEQKINKDRAYLNAMKVNGDQYYYVKLYQSQLKKIKEEFRELEKKRDYLDHKILELSYLLYNNKRWAQFLDSITHKASKNGVDIDYILNSFLDITNNFGHVLEVEIGCNGNFKNLIAFLNDIEQSDLVVDIYALSMQGANPTKLNFKVSVWGINY